MKVVKPGAAPPVVECYTCSYCGCEFEVSAAERMSTFTLHQPHNWACPECGTMCFSLTEKQISDGGKF